MARNLLGFMVLMLAFGCSRPQSGLQPFPEEKIPGDFPGVSYPLQPDLPGSPKLRGPVWVVGVDGASWTLIERLEREGHLPNLTSLKESAAYGTLLAEEPTISPALWATIATGVPRFQHGIVNFLVKLPGSADSRTTGPLDRLSPAIWEYVDAAGGEAAVISWFGSFPAETIRGIYVSKDLDPENPKPNQVHPESFAETLRQKAVVSVRQEDLDAIGRTNFLRETLTEDARTMAVLRVVAAERNPDLMVAYFSGIDVVQHVHWRDMDPETPAFPDDEPRDETLSNVIPSYYRYFDHLLGQILELLPANATLIVLSDHGGGPMDLQTAFRLRLRVLLEQIGLMDGARGTVLAIDEHFRHDKRIWLNLEQIEAHGIVPLDRSLEQTAEIVRRLGSLETDQGDPVFQSIRNHVAEPDWVPGDPALTVRFSPQVLLAKYVIDGRKSHNFSEVRLRRSDVSGIHRPEGILILRGPEVKAGKLAQPANHYQIAPLILYLLGLPQDAGMLAVAPANGGVNEHVIKQALLRRRPIRAVSHYPGTDRSHLIRSANQTSGERLTNPVEEAAMEKLRSLGYVN